MSSRTYAKDLTFIKKSSSKDGDKIMETMPSGHNLFNKENSGFYLFQGQINKVKEEDSGKKRLAIKMGRKPSINSRLISESK